VLEFQISFAPTPIWGGFKGIILDKKFNGSTTNH
jgi:hypothetical protein